VRERLGRLGLEGRVECLEPVLQVREFYRRIDIFTHGARVGETFGCVIAEAMASRIPVVTVSTPQRKKSNAQIELIEHNITGFVCRFSWQYANAVVELLKNHELRERFGQRGYEKAFEQFEVSRLTRKLEQIYTELMDMRGSFCLPSFGNPIEGELLPFYNIDPFIFLILQSFLGGELFSPKMWSCPTQEVQKSFSC